MTKAGLVIFSIVGFCIFLVFTMPVKSQEDTVVSTPTPQSQPPFSPFEALTVTFDELGYNENELNSPGGAASYSITLPENWAVQANNNFVLLDMFFQFQALQEIESPPLTFGSVTIRFEGQVIETFTLDQAVDQFQLRLPIPPDALALSSDTRYTLQILFDANFLCDLPHKATLTIYPTSTFNLNYQENPILPDLVNYPEPFYERASFVSNRVHVILPSAATSAYATNISGVTAKLGNLTGNQLALSTTLDIDLTQPATFAPNPALEDHLIILGEPEDNEIIPWLNELNVLPAPYYERQLILDTQGPEVIPPATQVSYVFSVTNTLPENLNFLLIDSWPQFTEFVSCSPECEVNVATRAITWTDSRIRPEELLTFTLVLTAHNFDFNNIVQSNRSTNVDNTVTLIENELGPLNASTLYSSLIPKQILPPGSKLQLNNHVAPPPESDYFFIYNGQAVAYNDGIVQEFVSPWHESRAILLITGLNEIGVKRASQAMSSETHFPRMSGEVALVRDVILTYEAVETETLALETTFGELGYEDRVLQGGGAQSADYGFFVPHGWQASDDFELQLLFRHTQLMDFAGSSLLVSFNRQPAASIALTEETSVNGNITVRLPRAILRTGGSNLIEVAANVHPLGGCETADLDNAWFIIDADSNVTSNGQRSLEPIVDLDDFPYPFTKRPDMFDLLFVLPEELTLEQWESFLNLVKLLGAFIDGKTIRPLVIMGDIPPELELDHYQIIVIGRPTTSRLIQEVNLILPQPFLPNSDEIRHELENVVLRLDKSLDVGLIELVISPWHKDKQLLVATGTTDAGVVLSLQTLIDRPSTLRYDLTFALVDEVFSIDTVGMFSSGIARSIQERLPTPTITSTEAITTDSTTNLSGTNTLTNNNESSPVNTTSPVTLADEEPPDWLFALVVGTFVTVFIIFGIAFWQSHRHKRRNQSNANKD